MRRKILVVDDNEMNRKILLRLLHKDYDIFEAYDGVNALEILEREKERISAVLLDILMPRMNGYEVLLKMKADRDLSQIPVIVATGSDEKEAERKALECGAIDFVTKPYDMNTLKNRLWNTIMLREQAAIVNATKVDALTGLFTRSAFFDKVNEMISQHKPGYYIMAAFDIERFKVINDQYGTKKGDEVLKSVAAVFLKEFEKAGGISCRDNADHFAVLYPKEFVYSDHIADIRKSVSILDNSIPPITFCIGRFLVDDLSLSPNTMYDRAVLAKETIKGRYDEHIAVYEDSMYRRIQREQEIISEMKGALINRQFEIWFQPQVNHLTKKITGAEALVRWRHPIKGLISPGDFIPVFEKNGFIYEVDKYVWEEVCRFLQKRQDSKLPPVPISVNISRSDIYHADIVRVICSLVEKYRVPVSMLHLEITESAFVKSEQQIISVVKELKKCGFMMEIDDFGSGYSSLNTLKNVPADVLKLDMKFLENTGDSTSDRGGNIIESIVRMAKWIGLSVIAEGVETKEQADFLQSVGCNDIQGYLYSKPIPEDRFEEMLQTMDIENAYPFIEKVDTYDIYSFWSPASLDTLVFNSFVGAASVFELCNGQIEIIRTNQKYNEMMTGETVTTSGSCKRNWSLFLSPEGRNSSMKAIQRAVETREEVTDEVDLYGVKTPSDVMIVRARMRVIAHTGGRYLFYCILEDITEKKNLEKKEKVASEQLQMVLENVGTGITAVKLEENTIEYLFTNDQFFVIHGYTREQYQNEVKDVYSLAAPEYRERLKETALSLNKTEQPIVFDFKAIKRDGKEHWVRMFGVQSKMKVDQKPVQICAFRDISYEHAIMEGYFKKIEQLQQMNGEMKHLVDDTPGGYARIHRAENGKFEIEYVNKGFCELIGQSRSQIFANYGRDITLGIHPDDIERVREEANRMWEERGTLRISYRLQHQNGSYFPVMAFGRVSKDAQGKNIVNIFYSDMTEEVREEEKRKELVDNLPCGIGLYEYRDGNLHGLYLNRVYWNLIGREPYDVRKSPVLSFIPEEEQDYVRSTLLKKLKDSDSLEFEIHVMNGKGKYLPFQVTANVIRRKNNDIQLYAVYMPITEDIITYRRMLPTALKTMMESSTDLAFIKDRALRYVYASRAFAKMVSVEDESHVIGKTDFDLFNEEFAQNYRDMDQRIIEEGESILDFVEEIPSASGLSRYSSTSKYLLKNENGEVIGIYGIGRDITDNRAAFSQLKLLTDSIPGGIVRFEVKKDSIRALYVSEGIRKLIGFYQNEHENYELDPVHYVYPEDQQYVNEKIEFVRKGESSIDIDFRIRLKDGTLRFINMKGLVVDKRDSVLYVNTVMLNVTEQRLMTERLRQLELENRQKYEHEMNLRKELVKNCIFFYQLNLTSGTLEEYTSKLNDVPGMKSGQLLQKEIVQGIFDRIYPEDRNRMQSFFSAEALKAFFEEGGTFREEIYRRLFPDGEYHYVKAEINLMEKPKNRDVVAFIFCTDEDEEYRRKLAVESILEADIESIIYINADSGMARIAHIMNSVNLRRIKGDFFFEDAIDQICEEHVEPSCKSEYIRNLKLKTIKERLRRDNTYTFTYANKNGKRKQLSMYYLDAEKKTIIVTGRDITKSFSEEQRQKEELKLAVEKANAANHAKSEFLSHMSHDIRTPLNAVLAFSNEEMTQDASEEKLREYLQKVNNSGEYLLGIVNDVLDMSRIEQKKIVLTSEPFSLQEFLLTINNVIGTLCKKKGITFFLDTKEAGTSVIMVDKIRFSQIVMNLLSNAVKFTKQGGTVALTLKEVIRDEKIVKRITVKDSGIGMSEEFIPHAFDSFNQEYRKETSERNHGTGLGLSIVKELVHLMNGTIELTSKINVGTTFIVEIPFKRSEVFDQKPEVVKSDFRKLKGVRILLTEDNEINMEIAIELLKKHGCLIECAGNGEEACRKFEDSELFYYQLILMDIRMPVMDGLTAARKIRSMGREDAETVPIIAMTADAFTEDERIAFKAGMNAYVGKPFRPDELYSVCCQYLK